MELETLNSTNIPALIAAALSLFRPLGIAWTAPGWNESCTGIRVKLALGVLLAALVVPNSAVLLTWAQAACDAGPSAILMAGCVELAVGWTLGLMANLVVSAARQAGEIVGLQGGLAPASVLDASSESGLNPLGHLHGLVALAVFLALDGPLQLAHALSASYQSIPIGLNLVSDVSRSSPWDSTLGVLAGNLVACITNGLSLAVVAAAPACVATMMAGFALAALARLSPTRTFTGMAWSIRGLVGIVMTAATIGILTSTLMGAWELWAAPNRP